MSDTPAEFPLTGQVCRVDYGEMVFEHDFRVPGKLSFIAVSGPFEGYANTVDISVSPIRDDIFAVSFTDAAATVVVIEDVAQRVVNTFMTLPDQPMSHLRGTLVHD
jgi:hypothetical protein